MSSNGLWNYSVYFIRSNLVLYENVLTMTCIF
uniref:Uncharacterized protein n=1 Tax=Anguilla anguilla TaxID=7936 RepID=A0A0E9WJ01_ANGAN